jgi:hypothetical protein
MIFHTRFQFRFWYFLHWSNRCTQRAPRKTSPNCPSGCWVFDGSVGPDDSLERFVGEVSGNVRWDRIKSWGRNDNWMCLGCRVVIPMKNVNTAGEGRRETGHLLGDNVPYPKWFTSEINIVQATLHARTYIYQINVKLYASFDILTRQQASPNACMVQPYLWPLWHRWQLHPPAQAWSRRPV